MSAIIRSSVIYDDINQMFSLYGFFYDYFRDIQLVVSKATLTGVLGTLNRYFNYDNV